MNPSHQILDSQLMRNLPQMSLPLTRKKDPYYIKHITQMPKIVEGQSNYVKFIIVCTTRTGSSLLCSLLNSHSRIVAFEELFQKSEKIGWYLPGYSQKRNFLAIYRNDPAEFLKRAVFCNYP